MPFNRQTPRRRASESASQWLILAPVAGDREFQQQSSSNLQRGGPDFALLLYPLITDARQFVVYNRNSVFTSISYV